MESMISEVVSRYREREERLRTWNISLTPAGAVREIERILWEMGEEPDPEKVKEIYLACREEDDKLIHFVRERVRNIKDPLTKTIETQEAIREFIHIHQDSLISWIFHKIYADIS